MFDQNACINDEKKRVRKTSCLWTEFDFLMMWRSAAKITIVPRTIIQSTGQWQSRAKPNICIGLCLCCWKIAALLSNAECRAAVYAIYVYSLSFKVYANFCDCLFVWTHIRFSPMAALMQLKYSVSMAHTHKHICQPHTICKAIFLPLLLLLFLFCRSYSVWRKIFNLNMYNASKKLLSTPASSIQYQHRSSYGQWNTFKRPFAKSQNTLESIWLLGYHTIRCPMSISSLSVCEMMMCSVCVWAVRSCVCAQKSRTHSIAYTRLGSRSSISITSSYYYLRCS